MVRREFVQLLSCVILFGCAQALPSDTHPSNSNNLSSLNIVDIPTTTQTIPTDSEDDVHIVPLASSPGNNSGLFGKTDAEQLGELSVIDILFRKRRVEDNIESQKNIDEQDAEEKPTIVDEVEVTYEEISSNESDDNNATDFATNTQTPATEIEETIINVTDILMPPSAITPNWTVFQ